MESVATEGRLVEKHPTLEHQQLGMFDLQQKNMANIISDYKQSLGFSAEELVLHSLFCDRIKITYFPLLVSIFI